MRRYAQTPLPRHPRPDPHASRRRRDPGFGVVHELVADETPAALADRTRIMWTHLLLLLFVALAVYAQNLTGFALALILLGLIGATDLVPLADAVNAVAVLSLVNAGTFLYRRRPLKLELSLWPAVAAGVVGVIAGTMLLTWLAGAAHEVLRLLLGLSIVLCALLLWRAAAPLRAVSSRASFAVAGALSGLIRVAGRNGATWRADP